MAFCSSQIFLVTYKRWQWTFFRYFPWFSTLKLSFFLTLNLYTFFFATIDVPNPTDIGCVALPWHFEFYILKCKIFLINFLDELDNFKQKIFYTKWKMKTHELSFTYKFYFNPSSNNVTKISTQKNANIICSRLWSTRT